MQSAKKETGINITIIDGNREAELIYKGVQLSYPFDDSLKLLMDVGGGSNEFIIGNKDKIFWRHSFNLGVARLMYKFTPSNPMKAEEIKSIEDYLSTEMQILWDALEKFPTTDMIGCAGCFSHHAAIELYAQAFEEAGALDKLEGFASKYGADFYGLPRNTSSITLSRQPWQLPAAIPFDDSQLVPLGAGTTLNWKMDL